MLKHLLAWLLALWYRITGREAVRLNLRVYTTVLQFFVNEGWGAIERWEAPPKYFARRYGNMAKINDTFTATIKPTNAAGKPAPVTDSQFFEDSESYDVVSVAADGLSAVLVARAAGTGLSVRVTALSKAGVSLTETKPLPDVEVPTDEEAVALNLTVA